MAKTSVSHVILYIHYSVSNNHASRENGPFGDFFSYLPFGPSFHWSMIMVRKGMWTGVFVSEFVCGSSSHAFSNKQHLIKLIQEKNHDHIVRSRVCWLPWVMDWRIIAHMYLAKENDRSQSTVRLPKKNWQLAVWLRNFDLGYVLFICLAGMLAKGPHPKSKFETVLWEVTGRGH